MRPNLYTPSAGTYLRWNARYAPIMMLKQTVRLSLTRRRDRMGEAHYKNLSHPFRLKFMFIVMPRFSSAIEILLYCDLSGNRDNDVFKLGRHVVLSRGNE